MAPFEGLNDKMVTHLAIMYEWYHDLRNPPVTQKFTHVWYSLLPTASAQPTQNSFKKRNIHEKNEDYSFFLFMHIAHLETIFTLLSRLCCVLAVGEYESGKIRNRKIRKHYHTHLNKSCIFTFKTSVQKRAIERILISRPPALMYYNVPYIFGYMFIWYSLIKQFLVIFLTNWSKYLAQIIVRNNSRNVLTV